jgi:hypothetical protein
MFRSFIGSAEAGRWASSMHGIDVCPHLRPPQADEAAMKDGSVIAVPIVPQSRPSVGASRS